MTGYFNDKNMAVITSRYVLFDKAPILCVFHNKDGIWEFYGKEELTRDDDYRVISIEELINLDLTILELSLMPPYCFAKRNAKNEPWEIHTETKAIKNK